MQKATLLITRTLPFLSFKLVLFYKISLTTLYRCQSSWNSFFNRFSWSIYTGKRAPNFTTSDLSHVARNESHYRMVGQLAATIVILKKKLIKPQATDSLAIRRLDFSFRVPPWPTCGALACVYASRNRTRTHACTCVPAQTPHVSFRSQNTHLAHISCLFGQLFHVIGCLFQAYRLVAN